MKHAIIRTSPKGVRFVGLCCLCGKAGLTTNDFLSDDCTNPGEVPQDSVLLMIVDGASLRVVRPPLAPPAEPQEAAPEKEAPDA